MPVFVSISDVRMAALIDAAHQRVIVAAPSFRTKTAEALERAVERIGPAGVRVVVDCSDEVFRLGFGDMEAVRRVLEAGCVVRQSAGLRTGVLITDQDGWTYTPTALYVSPEVHSDETPNAVRLSIDTVESLARALGCPEAPDAMSGATPSPTSPHVEVGVSELTADTVHDVTRSLTDAPPLPFDIARQVRVFEPYIQYVEISLRGCAIHRHRLEVPRSIQGLDVQEEISRRLRTTFEVVERGSKLSSAALESKLKVIRDELTRSLGKPWGRVILRARRPLFDERIAAFRKLLDEHRQQVESDLEAELEASRGQLVAHFLPLATKQPPDALLGQIVGSPSEEQVRSWLDGELARVFPTPADLITEMALDVQFRDVTYETLTEDGFAENLKRAYPRVEWERPFDEFNAAREREQESRIAAETKRGP